MDFVTGSRNRRNQTGPVSTIEAQDGRGGGSNQGGLLKRRPPRAADKATRQRAVLEMPVLVRPQHDRTTLIIYRMECS